MSAGAARAASRPAIAELPGRELGGMVRVLTCGSVDDGKSTLIGRLLWDASDLFEDQREALRRSPRRALDGRHLDYSLLVDGLIAEREQGITIDIAWRYFDTADRRFVIIDSPGHEQYTRNMASGASHADVAVMLIDARHGIKRQTRRHAAILDLFGVASVILAVNKMDLVDWSAARFREIEADFAALCMPFRFREAAAIPVAAVTGDNVARRSEAMDWYSGPTLLDRLNRQAPASTAASSAFRMPVQTVLRDGQDFRGLAGTVTSGEIAVGDTVRDTVSGHSAKVCRIVTMTRDLAAARRGQAVTLVLDADIDVSRGGLLAAPDAPPALARRLEVHLVWLSDHPHDPDGRYLLRTATDQATITTLDIASLLDLESLRRTPATTCAANDIAVADIALSRHVAVDTFAELPGTGAVVVVDAVTGATVAGGVITVAAADETSPRASGRDGAAAPYRLTRERLEQTVCADIAGKPEADQELRRRASAIAEILREAGVAVEIASLDKAGRS